MKLKRETNYGIMRRINFTAEKVTKPILGQVERLFFLILIGLDLVANIHFKYLEGINDR